MTDARRSPLSRRRFLSVAGAAGLAGLVAPSSVTRVFADTLGASDGQPLLLGHDLSMLQQEEAVGNIFSVNGQVLPLERIVKRYGATHVRLRLWVNPPLPFNDLPHVLAMAQRIRDAGLKLLLDFHYSDFWADPGHQTTPAAWQGQDVATLAQTVHDYTLNVLNALKKQGTPAHIVQIGNEITAGMLWPQGQLYVNGKQRWTEFTTLLKAGIAGARDAHPSPRVMVHIDRGGDNGGSRWFYDHIQTYGVDFDVIGLSYYPFWHGPLSSLEYNLNDLATRYGKDIVVVETAYPWTVNNGDNYPNSVWSGTNLNTPYPASPEGQLAYMQNVISVLQGTPGGHGLGMFYWEPDWIPGVGWEPGSGDNWDNLTLFDFKGNALPSIAIYDGVPSSNS